MSRQGPRAPVLAGAERVRVRSEMRAAYVGGLTITQVAAKFGRSYGCTNKLLHEAMAPIRGKGGRPW